MSMTLLLGLQWRYVNDDAASGISRFTKAYREYVARNRKYSTVDAKANELGGITQTSLSISTNESLSKLGVHSRRIDIGKHLELA